MAKINVYEWSKGLLINDDFRNQILLPDSIDLVITDPPYGKKYLYLYDALFHTSKDSLKDKGNLVFLTGHYSLPYVIDLGERYLRFWWVGWMMQTRIQGLQGIGVSVRGKPFLWFLKNRRRSIKEYGFPFDTFSSNLLNDKVAKSYHKWGQDYEWFAHYINELTKENEIVYDPMAGSGSVGLACVELNRYSIMSEISENAFNKSVERLEEIIDDGNLITVSSEDIREKVCSKIKEWQT